MISVNEILLSGIYFITLFYTVFCLLVLFEKKAVNKNKKSQQFPSVTVAIPAFNEEKTIIKTLKSVVSLDYPKNKLEVIIVNDGSSDRTAEIVKKFIAEYKSSSIKLLTQDNKGKWAALNNALSVSKSEFFACLDADSFIQKDALKKMMLHFDDGVTVVLPMMKVSKPKNILQKIQWYEYLINKFYKKLLGDMDCIHVCPGPFSLYRASVVKKLKGFKPAHQTEDLEMALRMQKHGYRIKQIMDAEVYTEVPANFKDLYKQRTRWNKGSVLNAWDYRSLIFNKKYGDFGFFQMPIILFSGFLTLSLLLLILQYSVFKPVSRLVHDLSLTNYDIITMFSNIKFSFLFLDLDYYKVMLFVMTFLISMYVVLKAHEYTGEKITKYGSLSVFFFIFFYFIILGFIWLGVTKDLILNEKSKWH